MSTSLLGMDAWRILITGASLLDYGRCWSEKLTWVCVDASGFAHFPSLASEIDRHRRQVRGQREVAELEAACENWIQLLQHDLPSWDSDLDSVEVDDD